MLVLRLVRTIARHWTVAAEGHHVRCSQCGTIAGPFEGSPLWVSAIAQLAHEYGETPPGFRCPGCGRDGPLRVGEVLANETVVACQAPVDLPAPLESTGCGGGRNLPAVRHGSARTGRVAHVGSACPVARGVVPARPR
jgi:hypothetical protein